MDEQKDMRENDPVDKPTEKPRKNKVILILSLVLGLALPIFFFILAVTLSASGFFGLFFVISMFFLMFGIVMFIVYCRTGRRAGDDSEAKKQGKSLLPYLALIVELFTAPVFLFAFAIPFLAPFLVLLSFLMPLAGIILGIIAMNLDNERISIVGKIFALTAIFLPLLTIFVFIILFSTGVLVFALM